MHYFIH